MLPLSLTSSASATSGSTPIDAQAPIGVFDSGVGGLSVLRHVRQRLPKEDLIYFSDALHAPYGGRTQAQIEDRALAIGAFLVQRRVKAIVVACNSATAAAIAALRNAYPALTVVGVEPGLKPAAALSRTGVVGVLATEATLASDKFARLRDQVSTATAVRFVLQPCPGLADLIETSAPDAPSIHALLSTLLLPMLTQQIDTIVLGCTHYPFVRESIETVLLQHAGPAVAIVDTGAAVARQLDAVLGQKTARRGDLRGNGDDGDGHGHGDGDRNDDRDDDRIDGRNDDDDGPANSGGTGTIAGFTSGTPAALDAAFLRLLGLRVVSRQA